MTNRVVLQAVDRLIREKIRRSETRDLPVWLNAIALHKKSILQPRSVTCHIRSHSLIHVNAPRQPHGYSKNEDANTAVKAGLYVPITNMRFPVSDLLTRVNQLCVKEWQQLWNQYSSNKIYSVQPVIGRNLSSSLSRYDSVLINRFRIGHTKLTNSSPKGREATATSMWSLPFSVRSQAHFGKLHSLQNRKSNVLIVTVPSLT